MKTTPLYIAAAALALAGAPLSAQAQAQPAPAEKDLVTTAIEAGSFQTLVAAVKAAGLVETLQGPGPFTVFAPTDEAFASLPAGALDALLKDPEALRSVLTYHVVPGRIMAAEVVAAGSAAPATVQGDALTIRVVDGRVLVDGATVVTADITASNGVIHVIDKVVLPGKAPGTR